MLQEKDLKYSAEKGKLFHHQIQKLRLELNLKKKLKN